MSDLNGDLQRLTKLASLTIIELQRVRYAGHAAAAVERLARRSRELLADLEKVAPDTPVSVSDAPSALVNMFASESTDSVEDFLAQASDEGQRFVVSWTGGFEEPTFFGTTNRIAAQAKYDGWSTELKDGDRVDLLVIDPTGQVTVEQTAPLEDSDDEC